MGINEKINYQQQPKINSDNMHTPSPVMCYGNVKGLFIIMSSPLSCKLMLTNFERNIEKTYLMVDDSHNTRS